MSITDVTINAPRLKRPLAPARSSAPANVAMALAIPFAAGFIGGAVPLARAVRTPA